MADDDQVGAQLAGLGADDVARITGRQQRARIHAALPQLCGGILQQALGLGSLAGGRRVLAAVGVAGVSGQGELAIDHAQQVHAGARPGDMGDQVQHRVVLAAAIEGDQQGCEHGEVSLAGGDGGPCRAAHPCRVLQAMRALDAIDIE